MRLDSERDLFRSLPSLLISKIERSVYNRRRRKLFEHREILRKKLALQISDNNCYIVDSIPLEICRLNRSARSSICKQEYETAPNRGYCACESTTYSGYRLHAVCTIDGVFTDFDISQASIHDIHYLKDIKQMYHNCTILGDKGYLSVDYQRDLFSSNKIKLEIPMRINQHNYKLQTYFSESQENALKHYFPSYVTNL